VGEYQLAFVGEEVQVPVSVTIHAAGERTRVTAYIDEPRAGIVPRGGFRVAGWAADPTSWNGSGIGAVHVWATRLGSFEAPVFLGAATLAGERPDVANAFGKQFGRTGWALHVPGLSAGTYDVTAYFWSSRTARFEDARSVRITFR
jgi:hypothetical protein